MTDETVHVSLMADLQDKQDKEAEDYLRGFPDKVTMKIIHDMAY